MVVMVIVWVVSFLLAVFVLGELRRMMVERVDEGEEVGKENYFFWVRLALTFLFVLVVIGLVLVLSYVVGL